MKKRIVPDNGPEQHKLARWIRDNGGEVHLYDGCVEYNVKTSTNANWRWKYMDIPGNEKSASIGDAILLKDGKFIIEYS